MVVARVLLELLTVLHRANDTVVVVFVASLASTKEQQKADQDNKSTNGDANDSAGGQNSAVIRAPIGSIGSERVRLFRDGTGRLAELAVGALVPGRALASGATAMEVVKKVIMCKYRSDGHEMMISLIDIINNQYKIHEEIKKAPSPHPLTRYFQRDH